MRGILADLRWKSCCLLAVWLLATAQMATAQESRRSRRGPPPSQQPTPPQQPAAPAAPEATPATSPSNGSADAKPAAESEDLPPRPEKAPLPFSPITALVNVRIITQDTAGTIEHGVVLVQDGKILAVGDTSTKIPHRATSIDLAGCVLTPGLIDSSSKLWLSSDSQDASASDASLDVLDGLDPYAEDWQEVVRHGVTSVYIHPANASVLGGFGAVLSTAPLNDQPLVHRKLVGLQASFGNAANNRTRSQQLDRIKRSLESAADYSKKWKEYNDYQAKQAEEKAKQAENKATDNKPPTPTGTESSSPETRPDSSRPDSSRPDLSRPGTATPAQPTATQSGTPAATPPAGEAKPAEPAKAEEAKPPKKPDVDPILENLVKVLSGEIPLHFEVQSSDDVASLDKLLADEKFNKVQVVLLGLSDLRSGLAPVVSSNRPLILGPWLLVDGASNRLEPPTAKSWGKDFAEYVGTIAIASNGRSVRSSRLLLSHAAVAIANGFSKERALRSVTCDAARLLGVDQTLGTIAAGKQADLVAFTGEPLSAGSKVRLVMVHGQTMFEAAAPASADVSPDAEVAATSIPEQLPAAYQLRSRRVYRDGQLQPAVLTIRDGKIVGIASADGAPAEDGLQVIDCGDAVITPGLFSAHSQLGLSALVDPRGLPDASSVVAADCLVNEEVERERLLRDGLTTVALAPGNSNPIAGTVSLVRLAGSQPILQREAALKLVLTATSRTPDSFPSSLGGQIQLLQQSLAGTLHDSRLYVPESVDAAINQRRLGALQAAAGNDKRLVVIAAQSDAEIRSALDLVERYALNAALLGPRQLKPFLTRIKDLQVAVIIQSTEPEAYAWFYDDMRTAAESGIALAFAGDSAEELRTLASLSGLPELVALKALVDAPEAWKMSNPGIQSEANADLVIWSDTPVHLSARPLRVIIDGKVNQ